jgi:hypothetical protein
MNRDSPDGRRVERNSASIWFPLQGEAVALADRRVVKRRLDQRGAKQDRADEFFLPPRRHQGAIPPANLPTMSALPHALLRSTGMILPK